MTTADRPPNAPIQTGPVAIYGATGFTGGLIARELKRIGADFLIAGRDPEKLERLSEELGGVPFVAASVDDAAELRWLVPGRSAYTGSRWLLRPRRLGRTTWIRPGSSRSFGWSSIAMGRGRLRLGLR
jgi:hypothetical protein